MDPFDDKLGQCSTSMSSIEEPELAMWKVSTSSSSQQPVMFATGSGCSGLACVDVLVV